MLLWGFLSLLQVTFLPGFIFLNFLNYQKKVIRTFLLSFSLSLSINYVFVLSLLALHHYSPNTIRFIFFVEIIVLLWLTRSFFFKISFSSIQFNVLNLLKKDKEINLLFALPKLIALLFIGYLILYYIFLDPNPKSIFNSWDAVVSWNRWAQNWSQNIAPPDTRDYPQLLPFNVSITYQFIGTTIVQLFGRVIFYIFPFAMVACLWDLGKSQKEDGYFWAIPFLIVFLITLFGTLSASGYADIPVAAMALLSLYPLLLSIGKNNQTEIIKNILIGTVICAGTSVTKQAGVYLALAYPFLIYLLVLRKSTLFTKKLKSWLFFSAALLLLLYMAPWYLYKLMKFQSGVDSSITPYLLSGAAYSVPATTLSARAAFAISSLFQYLNRYIIYIVVPILLLTGCITNNLVRILVLTIVAPISMVWLFYFSYDIRNIALALPFLSIALGFGLEVFVAFCSPLLLYRKNLVLLALLLPSFSSILFLLNKKYDDQLLIQHQIFLQKQLGNAQINKLIYSYFAQHPYDGTILTNNIFLEHLPELNKYYVYEGFASIDKLLNNIEKNNGGYLFILEQNVSNKNISTMTVEEYLDEHEGITFQKIFHEENYLFYKVIRKT